MIYLELSGGLGNQLFEYAMARSVLEEVRKQHPSEKLTLLLGRFSNDIRDYGLADFCVDSEIRMIPNWKQKIIALYYKSKKHLVQSLILKDHKLISGSKSFEIMSRYGMLCTTDVYNYYKITVPKHNIYIYGNFQSEKYFNKIKDIIKKDLMIKQERLHIDSSVLHEIQSSEAIAVHIRRGDYVSSAKWSKSLNICNEQYYVKAMRYFIHRNNNCRFFVFSNGPEDLAWIRNNMKLPGKIIYVDQRGSAIDDFYLMTQCKDYIISNSTFSWWAAYLSANDNKTTVAPEQWYQTPDQRPDDIYMNDWVLIDTNK